MTTYYKIIYDEQQVRRFHELVLPRRCIEALEQEFAGRFKEIGVNKNDMVPLPGTLQAGHEVVFKALSEYL